MFAAIGLSFFFNLDLTQTAATIGKGFGNILASIGLVVVLGSIIGVALERSGAAMVIAEAVLAFFGPKRPSLAVAVMGALVSIPVFCDSGFVLLSGISRSLAKRSGQSVAVLSLSLAAGLYTTHTLVPPTPGPVAAAAQLGAGDHLGTLMLLGGLLSIPLVLLADWLSRWLGTQISVEDSYLTAADMPKQPNTPLNVAPSLTPALLPSFLPLLLPIVCITLGTLTQLIGWQGGLAEGFRFLGQPFIALLLGCLPALGLARSVGADWGSWVQQGIALSGPILIVTGAGGAFGEVLKASPLQAAIGQSLHGQSLAFGWLLLLAFGIAALLKTAQGSSTNALVITAAMMAPFTAAAGLSSPVAFALLILAIGGGAMTVSHANDSYFWVVSRFSGISPTQAYRSFTLLSGLMGLCVLLLVLLLSFFV